MHIARMCCRIEERNGSVTCQLQTTQDGRNNLWTLLVAILVILIVALVFYLGRFIYRRRKDAFDGDEELNSKISQRLNSLDAFRG